MDGRWGSHVQRGIDKGFCKIPYLFELACTLLTRVGWGTLQLPVLVTEDELAREVVGINSIVLKGIEVVVGPSERGHHAEFQLVHVGPDEDLTLRGNEAVPQLVGYRLGVRIGTTEPPAYSAGDVVVGVDVALRCTDVLVLLVVERARLPLLDKRTEHLVRPAEEAEVVKEVPLLVIQ